MGDRPELDRDLARALRAGACRSGRRTGRRPSASRRSRTGRPRTSRSPTRGRPPARRGSPGPAWAATQPGPYWPRTTSVLTWSGRQRSDRPEDLDLLVAQGVRLERRRRLHGDQAQQLHQVVLEDVPARPGLLVERAAALDPERLGHGDLDMVDVAPVPERLEDPVAEPEDEEVADGLLAQVVVDPVDLLLAEDLEDLAVEPDGRVEVPPERLLDDDPPPAPAVGLVVEPDPPELGDDLGEGRRLGGQVVEPVAPRARAPRRSLSRRAASRSNAAGSAKSPWW